MRFAVGAFALLAVSGGVSAQCETCQCVIDDCLEVLAGEKPFPAQSTVGDCRTFLWERSTWGSTTSTITRFVTSGTITDTASATVLITVSEGTTLSETVTNTVTATRTTTSGAGSFTGEPVTTVIAPLRRRRIKRQAAIVPDYAQVCGGATAYSSACTCIGVSAEGTLWTEVPTATITVTSGTVATEIITETETGTSFVGESATETETIVKTATQRVFQPLYTSFVLQATNDDINGAFKGAFLYSIFDAANNNQRRLRWSSDINDATIYKADGSGKVTTDTGDIGFAFINSGTGPQLWQEPASANPQFTETICSINEDRFFGCSVSLRRWLAVDGQNNGDFRYFTYIENLLSENCKGPMIIKAVPQDTTTIEPAAAKNVVIQAKSNAGNGIYQGQYFGSQAQGSQPVPRIRFYASINDAIIFKGDPVTGYLYGPNGEPFSSKEPTVAQPQPFLYGYVAGDAAYQVNHMTADWSTPANDVILAYPGPPDYRYLGAVDTSINPGTPFFRIHPTAAVNSDEAGPLTLSAVEV